MKRQSRQENVRRIFIKYSLIEALYFALFAFYTYQTIFLQDAGLSSSQIGLCVSIASVIGLIASPIWGVVSDLLHSARLTFWFSVTITTVLFVGLPLVEKLSQGNLAVFYIYIPVIFIFKQASNSMLDGWCISEISRKGIRYGSVRMWGSIGYSIVSVILGFLVGGSLTAGTAFCLMIPFTVILSFICLRNGGESSQKMTVDGQISRKSDGEEGILRFKQLFTNRQFIIYLVYTLGLNIYVSVTVVFMPYILEASNCQAGQIGLVTGIRALFEICSMYAGAKLAKKIPLRYIMVLPGILFGMEHLCYRLADSLTGILVVMVLSGLAGGFFYSLGPSYIFEIVPKEVMNTAQTMNAMDLTIASILGSLIGGYVIKSWGIHALTTGCGVLILGLTLIFVVSLKMLTPNVMKQNRKKI